MRSTFFSALGTHPAFFITRTRNRGGAYVMPVYDLLRAAIRDFRVKLSNRYKVMPVYDLLRAVIPDFWG